MTDTLRPALGATVADQPPPTGTPHVLARLGQRLVAAPMAALLEVADLGEVTPVPLAPSWLLGITNLRGVVVPVVKLGELLGWEDGGLGRRTLVLRDGRFRLALPVHEVQSVRWLEPATATVVTGEQAMMTERAIVRAETVNEQPVWIIDAEALLARVRQGDRVVVAGR